MPTKRKKNGQFVKGGRKSGKRAGTTKKAASKRRRPVTQAGIGKPLNLGALVLGAAVAWNYADDARLVKIVKDPKTRYLVMAGAGLALGSGMVGGKLKIPPAARFFLMGAGVAAGIKTVQVVLPKLLPAPQTGRPMGRLTEQQMSQLRDFVAKQRAAMNGRGNVMTGRLPGGPVMTGRNNVMTGRQHIARMYRSAWG